LRKLLKRLFGPQGLPARPSVRAPAVLLSSREIAARNTERMKRAGMARERRAVDGR
jgi:hypothetical protein